MSHHASGPNFGFPRGDARLDMTDLYAFRQTGRYFQVNNRPQCPPVFQVGLAGADDYRAVQTGSAETNSRSTQTVMPLPIFVTAFSSHLPQMGSRLRQLCLLQGARAAGVGEEGEVIVQQAPVSVGQEALVTEAGVYRLFFGWRSDPFFFDAKGNFNHMQFTGDDFFNDKNVCSIVVELPNSALGSNDVGIWARTVDKTAEGWVQADRGGRPLQAVFLVGA